MTDSPLETVADLRHALSSPLSAITAEIQLMLMSNVPFDDETRQTLRDIEQQALRMGAILKATNHQSALSRAAVQETE